VLFCYNYSSGSIDHISNKEEEKKPVEYAVIGERERKKKKKKKQFILFSFSTFFFLFEMIGGGD